VGGVILVPQPMRAWWITPEGWKQVTILHPTVELSPECWRCRLEAVFEAAEGKTIAALQRQEREA
jgi:hypothetical protein